MRMTDGFVAGVGKTVGAAAAEGAAAPVGGTEVSGNAVAGSPAGAAEAGGGAGGAGVGVRCDHLDVAALLAQALDLAGQVRARKSAQALELALR